MKKMFLLGSLFSVVTLLTACSPEVGSDEWCEDLQSKDKGDWTLDETKNYAKHCVF